MLALSVLYQLIYHRAMKQKKPLEIISLLAAFGSVLCTPWLLHGAVKQSMNESSSNAKSNKSVQDEDYDIDVGVASSTECEPPSGEVVDGPD